MSTPTMPHQSLATGSLTAVSHQSPKRALLSLPLEQHPTRPGWAWLAASDGLVGLLVLLVASNLLPVLAPARASVTDNLEFVG
ncbi:MAG: hypothetical protein ACRDVW_10165, partial [Acidimicrobiales bacterium]